MSQRGSVSVPGAQSSASSRATKNQLTHEVVSTVCPLYKMITSLVTHHANRVKGKEKEENLVSADGDKSHLLHQNPHLIH
jgi:hypothetical protein